MSARKGTRTAGMRSKFEDKIAKELEAKTVGFEYETVKVMYSMIHSYTIDFILPNGIMIETKGYFTAADRAKHLAIKQQMPKIDIRFVFMKASNKLNKKSDTTYADWCDKYGFKWAEGSVPESWILEKRH